MILSRVSGSRDGRMSDEAGKGRSIGEQGVPRRKAGLFDQVGRKRVQPAP